MGDLYIFAHNSQKVYCANRLTAAHAVCRRCPELSKGEYTKKLGHIMCQLADNKQYNYKGMSVIHRELYHMIDVEML